MPEYEEAEKHPSESTHERCNYPEQNRIIVVVLLDVQCDSQ
jgi:hypothetical protein